MRAYLYRLGLLACLLLCNQLRSEPQTDNSSKPVNGLFEQALARNLTNQQDLDNYLQDISDKKWLSTTSGERFLSLFLADQTGKDQGIILCLPGSGPLPTEPGGLEYLRTTLPQHGWATMSIGLLNDSALNTVLFASQTSISSSAQPSLSEVQTTGLASPEITQLSTSFQSRLESALNEVQGKSPKNLIILTSGISGLWLYEAIQNGANIQQLRSIIMIDGYQPTSYGATNLVKASLAEPYPLLDITVQHPNGIRQAHFRQIRAKQRRRENYRQLSLTGYPESPTRDQFLLKHILGWINKVLKKN